MGNNRIERFIRDAYGRDSTTPGYVPTLKAASEFRYPALAGFLAAGVTYGVSLAYGPPTLVKWGYVATAFVVVSQWLYRAGGFQDSVFD